MTLAPEVLLVAAVIGVGILHTVVPDHWLPITLIARHEHWSRAEIARAAAQAGTGHVLSTLALGLVVWIAGVAVAARFGHAVSLVSALALVGFGLWIAIGSWRELRSGHGHVHDRGDAEPHVHADHGNHHGEQRRSKRTALLLILGSSPMVEGIPAFFAASRYGIGLIATMAVCFAASTIATYVALCVSSTAGLQRLALGSFERYGEVLSGLFIAIVGAVFLFVPIF